MIRAGVFSLWLVSAGFVAVASGAAETFEVADTLDIALTDADDAAARSLLKGIAWEPERFEVRRESGFAGDDVYARFTFASPRPAGRPRQDRVTLDWYAATDDADQVIEAPAVLVIHSLHPRMLLARMLARGLSSQGVHAFVIELPGYGSRIDGPPRFAGVTALIHARQGVADIRRARDVIAALPEVRDGSVSIEGTSLGGFAAATGASLDGAFDQVFLVLTGGDAFGALSNGQADAARLRASMKHAGYEGEKLRGLLEPVEPLRVAHRLDPQRTWLFSARQDNVIAPKHAEKLAEAIGLPEDHHVRFDGNHYSALVLLPGVVERMAGELGVVEQAQRAVEQAQAEP